MEQHDNGFKYKNKLPVGFLALVDDVIGITETGVDALKMNVFMNIKSAEKTLQFGPSKCIYMLIEKKVSPWFPVTY